MGIAVFTNYFTTSSWTPPSGVTQVTASCWGGGQGGAQNSFNGIDWDPGVGGSGGSYARKILAVSNGVNYVVNVGAGGAINSGAGGDSWFSSTATVRAKGGGSAATNIGDVTYNGGAGSFSGGGGGAGSSGSGGNAVNDTGGTGTGERGGNGGNALIGGPLPGNIYGGAGAGSPRTDIGQAGSSGSQGLVIVSYTGVQSFEQFINSGTWVCPAGVTGVTASCWGGGGAGGNGSVRGDNLGGRGGGGGGGGAFAQKRLTVVPGLSYTVRVGGPGADSWFSSSAAVLAKGGSSGTNASCGVSTCTGGVSGSGGQAAACIGDIVYSGGNGVSLGGGGGGGAGSTGAGGAASGETGGTGTPTYGGRGGTGGQSPTAGSVFGGAGGGGGVWFDGADWINESGAIGAQGLVILEYSTTGSVVINQNTGAFFFLF